MPTKPFDVNRSWMKFIAATLLLNLFILASFLTSTPERSPATVWITQGWKLRYAVASIDDTPALVALHKDSGKLSKEQCIACHGRKDNSKLPLHRIHLTSELLPGLVCHDCHRSIDIRKRTNSYVVRLVDVGFCKKCHSPFPGLKPDSPMKPADFLVDCTTCHSGKSAFRHGQPYLSHVISPRECKGCHGGRILPWTALHEQDDWLQTHGPEALRVGRTSCFKCHEFGLKFCDDCHKLKPPSHADRNLWATEHVDRARADTRTCFTCHKADFCKKCHVNHKPDWRQTHPDFVRARGDATCLGCHSESFCAACHTSQVTTQ